MATDIAMWTQQRIAAVRSAQANRVRLPATKKARTVFEWPGVMAWAAPEGDPGRQKREQRAPVSGLGVGP
jgi:hypothetical protein